MFRRPLALLILPVVSAFSFGQMTSSQTQEIIRRSAQATQGDWEQAPGFDFCEVDKTKTGSRTSLVLMIEGSPYYRLVQVNDKDLAPVQETAEQKRLASTMEHRKHETSEQRTTRIARYEQERHRDQEMLAQLTDAMNFTYAGNETINSHFSYVFNATPRPGYAPKSMETQVLTGMQGKLWIDTSSFRWVRVRAEVVKSVSIAGFLARVQPGTRFELEESPVGPEVWLPHRFTMHSRTKIIFLFDKSSETNETYFNYEPRGTLSAASCRIQDASAR